MSIFHFKIKLCRFRQKYNNIVATNVMIGTMAAEGRTLDEKRKHCSSLIGAE